MKVAQELYEGIDVDGSGPTGLITYMRTDSLRVSEEAVHGVRDLIQSSYGEKYLPPKPIRYAAGKNAQEAHEAIRPTDLKLAPEKIKSHLSHDQFRLYQLIYWRFVASQMAPAVFTVTDVAITAGSRPFQSPGEGPQVRRPQARLAPRRQARRRAAAARFPWARRWTCTSYWRPSTSPSPRPGTARPR